MPTLFDALQRLKQKPGQPQSQQGELQRIARAKSGKAQVASGPAASNLGEQRALSAGQTAGQQQAQAGGSIAQGLQQQAAQTRQSQALQGAKQSQGLKESLANIRQQTQLGTERVQQQRSLGQDRLSSQRDLQTSQIANQFNQHVEKLAADRGMSVDNMFQSFNRSNEELADRQDAAELEQTAFLLSMGDQAYLDDLNRVGQERRLNNAGAFEEEALNVQLGDNLASLMSRLDLQAVLGQKERDLANTLKGISINEALEIARAATKDAAVNNMVSGGTDLAKLGYEAYKKQEATNKAVKTEAVG